MWTGPAHPHSGYGYFNTDGIRYLAHRAAYATFIESIPEGMMICHKCDVRLCINPDHLFLGTGADNMADCARKRRQWRKLTDEEVRQIRSVAGISKAQLSRLYGVTDAMIGRIIRREWWRHTEEK